MEDTFSYKPGRRIFGYILCIFFIYMAYIFFKCFLQFNKSLSSGMWLLISMCAVALSIYVWNQTQVKITVHGNNILIKKLYNTTTFSFDDVIEYGRDTYRTRTSSSWRYYVILKDEPNKKIVVFRDGIVDIKVISAYIIAKSKNAKFMNVGPGMI